MSAKAEALVAATEAAEVAAAVIEAMEAVTAIVDCAISVDAVPPVSTKKGASGSPAKGGVGTLPAKLGDDAFPANAAKGGDENISPDVLLALSGAWKTDR